MNGSAGGNNYDIIVVGAGISGINAGYRIQERLPGHSYTILEARHDLGGTWSLFKYPGIRSDSDLHTFGYPFNPWQKPNPIALGDSVHEYMEETASKFGIDKKIQYHHRVAAMDWSSETQHWRLEVDVGNVANVERVERKIFYAKFAILGTGYYDYENPLDAKIPGLKNFQGLTVHPQFWPEDLDFKGKKMVIIGSGATAVTILPSVVAEGVGHATMLQRSPSYVMNSPQKKPGDKDWMDMLPRWLALRLVRLQFIVIPYLLYLFCQAFPKRAANFIRSEAKKDLPKDFQMDPHFYPTYNPWDQRLCFCPDSDFFKCLGTGRASMVTATIKEVVSDGIVLNETGEKLPADIIVTATGLRLSVCGKIAITVDKKPVNIGDQVAWHTTMLTTMPNLAVIIGYANASWTLGSDSACRLITRLIQHMDANKYTSATPRVDPNRAAAELPLLPLKSTYVKEGGSAMPKSLNYGPWLPRNNYFMDTWIANRGSISDGLEFKSVKS
ncbi:hypothetical protein BU24DRAFT_421106 [Aaosphaeria arxii CBS 175.79]|uniref:FAD/NAD(P)-binding domain-containing protein n=1 Tax=Aaosphaeria arxii CBS 175.79 TaxID=1450172 RepID=A0A6A5XYY3_9PLEO|nr:uncharacterized protein BU24DRAFT_421106 [Aaosphaeria arxii CBS 175.79]KAF2018103.1 hypothetical protein BU24DRAFT_421106 [Aaosphaeria arxii CBS 175.79]